MILHSMNFTFLRKIKVIFEKYSENASEWEFLIPLSFILEVEVQFKDDQTAS